MASKRDRLRNAMSQNVFNYTKDTSTPVSDFIDTIPDDIVSEESKNSSKIDELDSNNNAENVMAAQPISVDATLDVENTQAEQIILEAPVVSQNIERSEDSPSSVKTDIEIPLNTDTNKNIVNEVENQTSSSINEASVKNEIVKASQSTAFSFLSSDSLNLFKNGCDTIENIDYLENIKVYFSNEEKITTPISIRLDKELDVFSKSEAYKNKLTLNMYYNYIILKDMQTNVLSENYNPAFDFNNDTLYKKTPTYNSVQKTFAIIPELKEYLSVYGAKLGVTSGNYFKYILRKEYDKNENACIN